MNRFLIGAFFAGITIVFSVSIAFAALSITGIGGATINTGGFSGVGELSGLSYIAPTATPGTYSFIAISDNAQAEGATPRAYGINVTLNVNTGAIIDATVVSKLNLSTGYDTEGIAYKSGRLFVSDENSTSSKIREYNPATGQAISEISVPSVFANGRDNFGFESLTYGKNLWTANEEALTVDGNLSSTSTGAIIRLLKYNFGLNPAGQWAYQTDPKGSNIYNPSAPRCGVSDLLCLPDGTLLVLERYLGYGFRSRIYQVGFTGATDISGLSALQGASYTAVGKTRLWSNDWPLGDTSYNYEGMCIGPRLTDGSYSILMVADNAIGSSNRIYALKISGVVSPPVPCSIMATKYKPVGSQVSITGAITAIFGESIYVESTNRESGIRVDAAGHGLSAGHIGKIVNVTGIVSADVLTQEIHISSGIIDVTSQTRQILPLGLTNKSCGGGTAGGQAGVIGGMGLNTVGLLVRSAGLASGGDANGFSIADGSGVVVRVLLPSAGVTYDGRYVIVTGISSIGSEGVRVIRSLCVETVN